MRIVHGKGNDIAGLKTQRFGRVLGQLHPARSFDQGVEEEDILRCRHDGGGNRRRPRRLCHPRFTKSAVKKTAPVSRTAASTSERTSIVSASAEAPLRAALIP